MPRRLPPYVVGPYARGPRQIGSTGRHAQPPTSTISFVSAGTGNTGALGASSITITTPASTATNDLLICSVAYAAGAVVTITPAQSGWTQVRSDSNGTSVTVVIFTRPAASHERPNYAFNFSATTNAAGGISAYRSSFGTTPAVDVTSGQANTTSTNVLAAQVILTRNNEMLVGVFTAHQDTSIATPAGMSQDFLSRGPITAVPANSMDHQPLNSIGETGSRDATGGASALSIGQLVGLRDTTVTLSTVVAGVSTVADSLTVSHLVASTIAGVGTLSGHLLGTQLLASTITGAATLASSLAVNHALVAAVAGVASVNEHLSVVHALASHIVGTATVTDAISVMRALQDSIVGVATFAPTTFQRFNPQTASVLGSASVGVANETTRHQLPASISGNAQVAPMMVVNRLISVTIFGDGIFSPTIRLPSGQGVWGFWSPSYPQEHKPPAKQRQRKQKRSKLKKGRVVT